MVAAMSEKTLAPVGADYVSDVPYPRKFVPQIAPPMVRLVGATNGVPVPPEDDFDYCELGSANGDSLVLYAAANPGARFVGVDFNGEHVACSRDLVSRAKLENVTFLQRDFDELASESLPDFDFIVAHGILSWVKREKREAVYRFAAAKLKPGGLFYVSYDALPGWAAIAPLRRMMLERGATVSGSTLDRAKTAVEYLQRLADAGVGYFAQHPTAKSMLALMHTAGLPYVVHEYFHATLEPMYFADVEASLAAHGFGFVGQVPLHLNVRELATPPQVRKIAEEILPRTEFEMLKDFATNEFFRSDVYARGHVERRESETRFYFEGTPFGTMAPAPQIRLEAKLPHYTLDYKGPVYHVILTALSEGPNTAMQLAQRKELEHLGQSRIGDCLKNLVLGGQVVPMRPLPQEGEAASPSVSPAGRFRMKLAFNDVALEGALAGEGPPVLASPVTGAGLHLSLLELLALRMLVHVDTRDPKAWLGEFARKRGMPLTVGERKIKDVDELVRVMPRELEKIRAAAPKLVELAILEPIR
jgi:SAM-dependent methyltransferase